jgi:hypothetical protein
MGEKTPEILPKYQRFVCVRVLSFQTSWLIFKSKVVNPKKDSISSVLQATAPSTPLKQRKFKKPPLLPHCLKNLHIPARFPSIFLVYPLSSLHIFPHFPSRKIQFPRLQPISMHKTAASVCRRVQVESVTS